MKKSLKKHALKSQNNGTKTELQRAQSRYDKLQAALAKKPHARMLSKSLIPFAPKTLASSRQRKAEKSVILARRGKPDKIVGRTKGTNIPITELRDDKGKHIYIRLDNGVIRAA